MNKGTSFNINESAESFKERKRQALSIRNAVPMDNIPYTNPSLLKIGTEMGQQIIKGTNSTLIEMRNINLNINYERAIKSAYNLFK
jgi:hypothetical protein